MNNFETMREPAVAEPDARNLWHGIRTAAFLLVLLADIVSPSMPGYGFSGKPTTTGWNPVRIADAWDTLMKRLGYTRYVAQGGDWGAKVSEALARQAPEGLVGIHINLLLNIPPEIARSNRRRRPASRRAVRVGEDGVRATESPCSCLPHRAVNAPADHWLQLGRLTRRPGRLDARSRPA